MNDNSNNNRMDDNDDDVYNNVIQRWVRMDNWRIEILCATCKWT